MSVVQTGPDARLGITNYGLIAQLPSGRIELWVPTSGAGDWSVVQDDNDAWWIQVDNVPTDQAAILRYPPYFGLIDEGTFQVTAEAEYDAADLPTSRGVETFIVGNAQPDGRGYPSGMGYESVDPDNPVNALGFVDAGGLYTMASEAAFAWADDTKISLRWSGSGTQRGYMDDDAGATIAGAQTDLDGEYGSIGLMAYNDGAITPLRTGYARFRNLALQRGQSVTVRNLTNGWYVMVGTIDGRVRITGVAPAGSVALDMQPYQAPWDYVAIFDGDPDAGGDEQLVWFPPQKLWGGDELDWDALGFTPETNVSATLPTSLFEQIEFPYPIAGWGVELIPSTGMTFDFQRSIIDIPTTASIAIAQFILKDQISDSADRILYEATVGEPGVVFNIYPNDYLRIDGPNGLADMNFHLPIEVVNLIGAEDSKQYEIRLIDSTSHVWVIDRGLIRCLSEGL